MIVLGIDIGGTSVVAGVIDVETNDDDASSDARPDLLWRATRPTPRGQDAIVATCQELWHHACRALEGMGLGWVEAVGVGAPGVVVDGVVVSASEVVPGWAGVDLAASLTCETSGGPVPVYVDNDVRALALGEATWGGAAGAGTGVVVSLGTGVGGVLVTDGRLGAPGELAHLQIAGQLGVHPCGCGRLDHLESVACGPAIAAEYARAVTGRAAPVDNGGGGIGEVVINGIDLPRVRKALVAGDPTARQVVTRAGARAGACLAGFVSAVGANRVVVAGGAFKVGPLLLESLEASLRSNLWPHDRHLEVVTAGADAAVLGAARLAVNGGCGELAGRGQIGREPNGLACQSRANRGSAVTKRDMT